MIVLKILILLAGHAHAEVDFFVIGDSQISHNHHVGFEDFFSNPRKYCGQSYPFDSFSFSGYGASGSGFHDWLEPIVDPKAQKRHGQICNMGDDKKWFGQKEGVEFLNTSYHPKDSYWLDTCTAGNRAIDRVLSHVPKVVVASFLGAHQKQYGKVNERWTKDFIFKAVKEFETSIPDGVSCIVVTSPPALDPLRAMTEKQVNDLTPSFLLSMKDEIEGTRIDISNRVEYLNQQGKRDIKGDSGILDDLELLQRMISVKTYKEHVEDFFGRINKWRQEAAKNIHEATVEGGRCILVKGYDQDTLKNLASHPQSYLNEEEVVSFFGGAPFFDPFHLTVEGSLRFFEIKKDEICNAFAEAYRSAN